MEGLMKHLVRFELENGESIVVAVDEPEHGTSHRASQASSVIEDAQKSFKQALSTVRSATETAITQLRDLSTKPDEIEMEFGFTLNGTFGAIIAEASAEANYKVTVRWKAENQQSNP